MVQLTLGEPQPAFPKERPRIAHGSAVLGAMSQTATMIREAAYADLPGPIEVLVTNGGEVSLSVRDFETLNRWANWLGGTVRTTRNMAWLRVEAFGLRVHITTARAV